MKTCINNSCKAELDDYMEICPECGRLQKRFKMPDEEQRPNKVVAKERNGFISFWLWLIIVGNALNAVSSFFPKVMWGSGFPDAYVIPSVISGLFSIVNIVGASMLLSWKKIGFVVIVVSSICGGLFAFFTIRDIPIGLVGIFILWMVLKMKKNGIPYWDCLD